MSRYFIELAYKGTTYSGFQSQKNANTIQAEVEKAFKILQKTGIEMIGSSRTDAGVHAHQNFFHFDFEEKIHPQFVYKMNAILPADIVIKNLIPVPHNAHCRFDAVSRRYHYYIYRYKNPFLSDRAFYYPYALDLEKLQEAADIFKNNSDFASFSKRRTQVKHFICNILESQWVKENEMLVFEVEANRFLRGMVRGMVATMLLVGRNRISIEQLGHIIKSADNRNSNFAAPARGLFLIKVDFPFLSR